MSGKLTNYMLMIAAEKMDAQSTPDAVGVMEVTEILRVTVLDYLPGKRKETDIFPICDPPGGLGYKETTLTGVINKSEIGRTRRALTKEYMRDMCAVMRDIVRVIVDRLEACVDRHLNEGSQFPSMTVRRVIEKVRQHLAWQTTEVRQGPTNKDSNLPKIIETYQGYGKATEISDLTASQIDPGLVDLHSLVVQWAHSGVLVHFKDTEIAVNMAFLHNLVSRFLGALRGALDIQGDVLGEEDVDHLHVQFHEGTISQMGGKEYAELNLKDGTFQKGQKRIKKTGTVLISIVPDRLSGTTMNALQGVKEVRRVRKEADRAMHAHVVCS